MGNYIFDKMKYSQNNWLERFILDIFKEDFKRWKKDDGVYSESHSFSAMLDKVRKQPYMTFVGVPGSGKSATIQHIALQFQKEEGYEIVPIIDIRKIEEYSDSRHPQVFVIDDVVGVHGLQKQKSELLIDYEKRFLKPSNENTKVLMSCRKAVFNECKKCYKSFFSNEENTIKMQNSEHALNDEDKKAILQKHGIDIDLLSPAFLKETSDMFPLLCKLYSKEVKFRKNAERFFTCPAECILRLFDEMQGRNRLCYATLVLCMLNDNKLSQEILKNTGNKVFWEMKSKVIEHCEVESYNDTLIVNALAAMEGTYTKICGTEYTIIHDSVFEILAYHFDSQFPDLVLQHISSSYIANKVKLLECKRESEVENNHDENEDISVGEHEAVRSERSQDSFDLCIRLREEQCSMLAKRLYRDIENMELYDVFMNDVLKHPKVCQAFIEVLETKSYTDLKSLFLSEQKDVSKVVSKRLRVREESDKRDKRSKEWQRQKALLNEGGITGKTYSVRVVSWVVYYGHNQILRYILQQTDLHKETEIELFWNSFSHKSIDEVKENIETDDATDKPCSSNTISDTRNQKQENTRTVSEHDRTFLLSCYSGDLETVRILIKYVDLPTTSRKIRYIFYDTPLTAACEGGHLSIVKELLEAKADINLQGENDSPLTAACKGGYTNVVNALIEAGADINQQGEYDTPLTAACEGGYVSVVKKLLQAGADINQQGKFDTPLIAACQAGHTSLVKELIEAEADINHRRGDDTPLTAACKGGYTNVVNELIEAGADINQQGRYASPMTAACAGGHMSVVKELIKAKADINQQGKIYTPLTAACAGGHIDVVKELIKGGANVNQPDVYDTPLTAACVDGHVSVVKELLNAKADINKQGEYYTPLTAACEGGHVSVVKELLEAKADINHRRGDETPLTAACKGGHMSVVKELKKNAANVNQQGRYASPMTAACAGGHMSVVKELIKAEADINQQGKIYTPLTAACAGGHIDVVKELIKDGANVNQPDVYDTPLTAACVDGHVSVVKKLIEAGADINQQGEYYTPLTVACEGGHVSVVKELLEAGADTSQLGEYDTPLTAARDCGHKSLLDELTDAGSQ